MQLDKYFTVEHDGDCWVLKFERENEPNPETGKPSISTWRTFHATLIQALKKYIDSSMDACESVVEIHQNLNQAMANIENMIKSMKNG